MLSADRQDGGSQDGEDEDPEASVIVDGDAMSDESVVVDVDAMETQQVTEIAVSDRPFSYPNVLVLPIGRRPLLPGIIHPFVVSLQHPAQFTLCNEGGTKSKHSQYVAL